MTLKEIPPPPYEERYGYKPTETPCPKCGGWMLRGPVRCPDGRPGCCVIHYGFTCKQCGRQFE